MSSQMGWPEGASAECGKAMPSASATTCGVAAVPRNWQPPPGLAQARQPSSAASCRETSPWTNRDPIDWTLPASSPWAGGNVTPPGTITPGRPCEPARASIIAGRPLSHVATPSTPFRRGSERIRRRKTTAASLRYGRLSIIPGVPWVRPSHGSETMPANGATPAAFNSSAASRTSSPTSQCPVWNPSAIGEPSLSRMPPCVLRIRNGSRATSPDGQPMPAFWLRPKRSPEGQSRSIVSVSGSDPAGPSARVVTSRIAGSVGSIRSAAGRPGGVRRSGIGRLAGISGLGGCLPPIRPDRRPAPQPSRAPPPCWHGICYSILA